ncbi:MAG: F0F1 ATP synthase subunit B [Patescibacteria group bacterium]
MSQPTASLYKETQETQAEESVAASLGLNLQLFLFQLINFALVVAIVWFLILKPLTKKMEERKKLIDESLDNAKKIDAALAMSEKTHQERIAQGKEEANRIIAASREEGEKNREELKQKTHGEITALVKHAKQTIEEERISMREELRTETAALAVAVAEKILREKLDGKKDAAFIEEIMKKKKVAN